MIVRVGVGEETCSMGAVGPFRPLAASICSIRLAVTCAAAEPQTNRIPRASTLPAFGSRKMRLSVNGCFIAGCPYGRNRSLGGMNHNSITAARNAAARHAQPQPFWVMRMLPQPFRAISVGWLHLGRLLQPWT